MPKFQTTDPSTLMPAPASGIGKRPKPVGPGPQKVEIGVKFPFLKVLGKDEDSGEEN